MHMLLNIAGLALGMFTQVLGRPMIIGYYPPWKRAQMANVDFSKYTHINLSFGIPTAEGTFSYEGDWFLAQTVADIHSKGAKVLLSVGGWTGSNYFSNIVKSASTRSTMVTSMVNYVKTNNLDGIDIDWEYPGRLGNTCNIFDTVSDTPNFLVFLQELRAAFDSSFGPWQKLITLAVRVEPFDVTGGPSKDIAAFAKVVDYANLIQYDINGGWNAETGPNAPFNFEQGKGAPLSFVTAIDSWTGAGWPAVQLTAGIGYYGRSTIAKVDMTKDPNNQYQPQESVVPLGDSEDAAWYDACAGTTSNSGTWMWKHLCNQGVLSSPSTAAAPWVRQWDPVSQTPWLFNPTTKQLILYDDPQSIKIKVDYAAAKGLGGTMIWSINMDYNNKLIDVIHSWNIGGPPINTTISADSSTAAVPTASNTATITTTITVTPSKHYPTVTIINGSGNSGETPVPGSSCLFNKVHKCAKISGKDDGYNVSLWHMGGSIMR